MVRNETRPPAIRIVFWVEWRKWINPLDPSLEPFKDKNDFCGAKQGPRGMFG